MATNWCHSFLSMRIDMTVPILFVYTSLTMMSSRTPSAFDCACLLWYPRFFINFSFWIDGLAVTLLHKIETHKTLLPKIETLKRIIRALASYSARMLEYPFHKMVYITKAKILSIQSLVASTTLFVAFTILVRRRLYSLNFSDSVSHSPKMSKLVLDRLGIFGNLSLYYKGKKKLCP